MIYIYILYHNIDIITYIYIVQCNIIYHIYIINIIYIYIIITSDLPCHAKREARSPDPSAG